MTERPIPPRGNRKHWAIAGGIVAAWLVCEFITGSYFSATVLLVALGALGAIAFAFARHMGYTQRLASRPWRSAPDVLRVASRHLNDVFVITPSGKAIAPVSVELQLNPDDLAALCEQMDLAAIGLSLTEAYEQAIERRGAQLGEAGRPGVYVVAESSLAPGRFRFRRGRADAAAFDSFAPNVEAYAPQEAYARQARQEAYAPAGPQSGGDWVWTDGITRAEPRLAGGREMPTAMERAMTPIPVLRLVTGNSVAETTTSGHRAGRGNVEMVLPDVPTISREHARFTFSDGHWWVTNMGLNGIMLNGAEVNGERPLSDGDTIRWGSRPDAVESRVEIA